MELVSKLPDDRFFNQMIHILDQRNGPSCLKGIPMFYKGPFLTYEEREYIDIFNEEEMNKIISKEEPEQDEEKGKEKKETEEQDIEEIFDTI